MCWFTHKENLIKAIEALNTWQTYIDKHTHSHTPVHVWTNVVHSIVINSFWLLQLWNTCICLHNWMHTYTHKLTQMAEWAHSCSPLQPPPPPPPHTHKEYVHSKAQAQAALHPWSLWTAGVTVAPQPEPSSTADVNEVPDQWLPWAPLLLMTGLFWSTLKEVLWSS